MRIQSVLNAIPILVLAAAPLLAVPAWPGDSPAPDQPAASRDQLEKWLPRLAVNGKADCRSVRDSSAAFSPCARIGGNCLRKVRITADPDLQSVRMERNMEVDGKKVGGYQLTLVREPAP